MELSELRKEIDEIDDKLVLLFCQRMQVASKVADYKKATGSPIFHPGREQEILQNVSQKAGPELEEYTRELYATIFQLSRRFQSRKNQELSAGKGMHNLKYRQIHRGVYMKCGLLGRKLVHSYSPQIHQYLGPYRYDLFEKEPEEISSFVREGDFTGINVTIPYKKDVIPFLDELSPKAIKMGSVNTIIRRPDGTLFGHNTDYFGFHSMVLRSGITVPGKKVLVLGTGGTSNTAVKVLEDLGATVITVSRSGNNNYQNLHQHKDAVVIVNTTPVGMYPNTGASPVDLTVFPKLEGVLDVIYNPARTQLLLDAEKLGLPHENGLWMLVAQAKEAAEYFSGKSLPDSLIEDVYRKMSAKMQNIVLIGMPGCGKSTIASLLAEKLGRISADADQKIEEMAGKTIPEIFAEDGEAVFREWETKVLSDLGKQSQLIIATGGGCVTQPRNYPLLHQNGSIFWITRDLDQLATDGRPLSLDQKMTDMYAIRKPLYQEFADHIIDNNGTCQDTVRKILTILEEDL